MYAGEVINADHSNNTFDKSWNFDGIGNRKTATDSAGTITYTANPWNQYTAITGQPVGRTQDADGNLTSGTIPADLTANSTLAWDAENRLKKITKPNGDVIDFDYDYMSRRIQKTVHQHGTNPNNESQITNNSFFVYDDWNPIGEYTLTATLTSTLSKSYLWGMDLSGSIQGAGGVGGLLAVTDSVGSFYPTFDGNGNVTEYLNSSGVPVAHYEYDAFGNTLVKTGALADSFAHRFSTKPLDAETGLYYYGYRYYDPMTGRWPSRDPIGEWGGINLYGIVGNRSTDAFDRLGLEEVVVEMNELIVVDGEASAKSSYHKAGHHEWKTVKGVGPGGVPIWVPSRAWVPGEDRSGEETGIMNLSFNAYNQYAVNPDKDEVRSAGNPVFHGLTGNMIDAEVGPFIFEVGGLVEKSDGRELIHNVRHQTMEVSGVKIKTIYFKVNVWTTVRQSYKFGLTAGMETAGWIIGANETTTSITHILVKKNDIELSATFCSGDGGVTWNPWKNENK